MWELFEETPYGERWAIAYFVTEGQADAARKFQDEQDDLRYPNIPREDRDWGYGLREINIETLETFKEAARYRGKETLGGDNCYIGRGLFTGQSVTDALDHGINTLTHS